MSRSFFGGTPYKANGSIRSVHGSDGKKGRFLFFLETDKKRFNREKLVSSREFGSWRFMDGRSRIGKGPSKQGKQR